MPNINCPQCGKLGPASRIYNRSFKNGGSGIFEALGNQCQGCKCIILDNGEILSNAKAAKAAVRDNLHWMQEQLKGMQDWTKDRIRQVKP